MEPIFHMVALFLLGAMSSRGTVRENPGHGRPVDRNHCDGSFGLNCPAIVVSPQWNSVAVDALLFFTVIGLSRLALSQHPIWGKRLIRMG